MSRREPAVVPPPVPERSSFQQNQQLQRPASQQRVQDRPPMNTTTNTGFDDDLEDETL
jgi:hypothetical protein